MATVSKRKWEPGNSAGGRKSNGRRQGESWQVTYKFEGKWKKKAGFKTRAEAEAWGVAQESKIAAGVARPQGERITLAQFSDEFLANSEARRSRDVVGKGHIRNMKGHLRNYILRSADWKPHRLGGRVRAFDGGIGHIAMAQLRPAHIEKFRDDLLATGLDKQTVRAILTTLHIALDYARRRDYIATNPADRIKIETPRGERLERRTPPSKEAIGAILRAAPEPLKFVVQFIASTGLRAGEARALQNRHVNVVLKTVTVEQAADFANAIGPPKSLAGYRSVPISDHLCDRIEEYRATSAYGEPDDFFFTTPEGGVVNDGTWLKQLYNLFDELNWPLRGRDVDPAQRRFVMHELRHYAISSWIAAELGLKAVQTFAGHSDIRITWNRYGHLFPDESHQDKINTAAASVFAEAA